MDGHRRAHRCGVEESIVEADADSEYAAVVVPPRDAGVTRQTVTRELREREFDSTATAATGRITTAGSTIREEHFL